MVLVWHLCQSCMVAHSGKMEAVGSCGKSCGGLVLIVMKEGFDVVSIDVVDKTVYG